MLRHHRGNRRVTTEAKVARKLSIIRKTWGYGEGEMEEVVPGKYRKGKVHCSCPMCSAKTNSALNRSKGPVYNAPVDSDKEGKYFPASRGCRLSVTNGRYGKKNYKPSDRKKVDRMLYSEYGYSY